MSSNATDLDARLRLIVDPSSAKAVQDFFKSASQQADTLKAALSGSTSGGLAGQAAGAQQVSTSTQQTTTAMAEQLPLAQRLAEAAAVRASTESGILADLRLQINATEEQTAAQQTAAQGLQRPTRLAFSLNSLGGLASTFGLNGPASALTGAGSVAGGLEAITQLNRQIDVMAERLLNLDNVFGQAARAGGDAAMALGADGGGLAATLAVVGAVAIPIVVVLGAIALALSALQAQADTTAKGIVDSANEFRQISQQSATMTTPQLKDQQSAALSQMNVNQQLADNADRNFNDYLKNHPLDIDPTIAHFDGTFQGLQGAATDADAALAKSQDAVAGWSIILDGSTGKINDNIQVQKDAQAVQDAGVQGALAGQQEIRTMTTKQLQDRLSAVQSDAEQTRKYYSLESADQQKASDAHLEQLKREQEVIEGALTPALTNFFAAVQQNSGAIAKFVSDSAALQQQYDEQTDTTLSARLNAQVREAQDFGTSRGRELTAFNLQQDRADQDKQLQQAKDNLTTKRQAEDLAARIKKIFTDALQKMGDAVADRDALAYIKAQRDRDKQINDLNQQSTVDDQRRKEDQVLTDQATAIAQQRQVEDFQTRLQNEDQDRATRMIRLYQDNNEQDRIREVAYTTARNKLIAALNDQTGIITLMSQGFTNFLNNARAAIAGTGAFQNPLYQNATYASIPGPSGQQYAGGHTINLNVQGATQQNVIATSAYQAGQVFGDVLRLLGAR